MIKKTILFTIGFLLLFQLECCYGNNYENKNEKIINTCTVITQKSCDLAPLVDYKKNEIIIQQDINNTNYAQIMIDSVFENNIVSGQDAEKNRNEKIDNFNLDIEKISFNDLLLLSKLIHTEAGSSWLSEEWKLSVGEVLLNRVNSPEFPNSIKDCIYQTNQYGAVTCGTFDSTCPSYEDIDAAWKLLNGYRSMEPSVVFQAEFSQGSGIYKKLTDKLLGTTYFCFSSYPDLYK
jgi:hypothetical protein